MLAPSRGKREDGKSLARTRKLEPSISRLHSPNLVPLAQEPERPRAKQVMTILAAQFLPSLGQERQARRHR